MTSDESQADYVCRNIHRRRFFELSLASSAVVCFGCDSAEGAKAANFAEAKSGQVEARFYEKFGSGLVQCHVCPRECLIKNNDRGYCRTRENRDGTLYTLVWGNVAALQVDAIEKKPFYHVLPGSKAFSIATVGCNIECKFCQNWSLSQAKPEERRSRFLLPKNISDMAKKSQSASIAYTYSEPTVFTEYVYDCAVTGNDNGLKSVVVSNGYINPKPLERLCEVIAAYKVDFKAFSRSFYKEVTGGDRDRVLESIKLLKKRGIWTELVHLTIPTLNDNEKDFAAMADWLLAEIDENVPVHFTRFHPMYKLTNLPVTPLSTLERARDILMEKGMKFVYVGNVPGHPGGNTYCPKCGKMIIERVGFSVVSMHLKNGNCGYCGTSIPGVWT